MAAKTQLRILVVGKLRERFWQDAEAEYRKRLTGYTTRMEIVEVADEATDADSPALEEIVRRKEGDRLLARIGERDYVIALTLDGTSLTSPALAAHLERVTAEESASVLTFVIGGSLGLHPNILARANFALSFGALTFPHQMIRVMLLEQVYRAFKIQRGEAYHK